MLERLNNIELELKYLLEDFNDEYKSLNDDLEDKQIVANLTDKFYEYYEFIEENELWLSEMLDGVRAIIKELKKFY